MHSQAIKLSSLYLPVLLICVLTLSACENSLNDIKKIASKESDKPISRSTDVDIIYSDSAKVKIRVTAPLVIDHDDTNKPYREMTKGIKLVFYNDDLTIKGTITADYAIQRDKENITEFRKNVVATNSQGQTFKSEELIDDENQKKFYSTKPVAITSSSNGDVMYGSGANSNSSMFPWNIDNSTGVFHVDEKQETQNQ
jgi:LPS export ABC transporter protein LptC